MTLEKRLQTFSDRRVALLDEVEALDHGVLVAKPLPGKWSILEVVEHLVLAERAVFRGMPEPARLVAKERRLGHRVRYLLVMLVLKLRIRVRVPSAAMIPQGNHSLAELRRFWEENQDWLRSCIDHLGSEIGRKAVFKHPVSGPLTVEQAVRMAQIHLDGHIRQIRRLRARVR